MKRFKRCCISISVCVDNLREAISGDGAWLGVGIRGCVHCLVVAVVRLHHRQLATRRNAVRRVRRHTPGEATSG